MGQNKGHIILSFLAGFLFGITLFALLERRNKRKNNIDRIKNNLNKGFLMDKENLHNDWQHIYQDLDRAYKHLKEDINETV